VPYEIVGRRPGDVAEVYADPSLAHATLGWRTMLDVDAMCRDAWRWQSMNPDGYRTPSEPATPALAVAGATVGAT
jgi:UDP-glucose 4-epimerase